MNNTAETDFFGFPKVKWLHLTGEVDKSVRCARQVFSGQSYSTNKKVDFFDNSVYKYLISCKMPKSRPCKVNNGFLLNLSAASCRYGSK